MKLHPKLTLVLRNLDKGELRRRVEKTLDDLSLEVRHSSSHPTNLAVVLKGSDYPTPRTIDVFPESGEAYYGEIKLRRRRYTGEFGKPDHSRCFYQIKDRKTGFTINLYQLPPPEKS